MIDRPGTRIIRRKRYSNTSGHAKKVVSAGLPNGT
jgi:hypothetical protein